MKETMGQIIRRLRKERNMTQEELAEQLNISFQAVSKWENDLGMPDISQIVPLTNVFGVSCDVIFGTEDTDCEKEITEFINAMEVKICNKPDEISAYAHNLECVEDVQRMLKTYPNNYRLLAYSIGHIECFLDFFICDCYSHLWGTEIKDRDNEKNEWIKECVRQANLILNHCTDVEYLNSANRWLVCLYQDTGELDKAEEHAQRLPQDIMFNSAKHTLAGIYAQSGRTDKALEQYGENVFMLMDGLEGQLFRLAMMYENKGMPEEALACYSLYPAIYELMLDGKEDEIPYYLFPSYNQAARMCMLLGREDEAISFLEKWIHHERTVKKNYNRVTKSVFPYFGGKILKYSKNSYSPDEDILNHLKWEVFDPIRDDLRFIKIVSDAEELMKEE